VADDTARKDKGRAMHQRRALVLIAILMAVGASAQTLHQGHDAKATCKDTPASKPFARPTAGCMRE
jgi:hypothetical protein